MIVTLHEFTYRVVEFDRIVYQVYQKESQICEIRHQLLMIASANGWVLMATIPLSSVKFVVLRSKESKP